MDDGINDGIHEGVDDGIDSGLMMGLLKGLGLTWRFPKILGTPELIQVVGHCSWGAPQV